MLNLLISASLFLTSCAALHKRDLPLASEDDTVERAHAFCAPAEPAPPKDSKRFELFNVAALTRPPNAEAAPCLPAELSADTILNGETWSPACQVEKFDPACQPRTFSPACQLEKLNPASQLKTFDPACQVEKLDLPNIDHIAQQLGAVVRPCNPALSEKKIKKFLSTTSAGWQNLKRTVFEPLQEWRKTNVAHLDQQVERVFYPFGGPDAAYVTQFFPNAREYILVGLERTGSSASAKNILSSDKTLYALNKCMEHFFQKGYFVTSYMQEQISSQQIGTTPVIMSQLAQLGYEIIDVINKSISLDGIISDDPEGRIKIVQIRFRVKRKAANDTMRTNTAHYTVRANTAHYTVRANTANDTMRSATATATATTTVPAPVNNDYSDKTLIYVACSVDNANDAALQALQKYVSSKAFATFIKSASYKFHDSQLFSELRTFVMTHSVAILQDDTGIPYKLLEPQFDTTLFGIYNHPTLKEFLPYNQPNLAAAYKKQTAVALPFLLGYGCLHAPSNLLLAVPKAKATTDATSATSATATASATATTATTSATAATDSATSANSA
ncbi:MAG: hypothetical protein LBR89_01985 [Holosporales bacterium]|jgi:hypothetical protein|nr:hypothetical protein [Holosporales bacterium]